MHYNGPSVARLILKLIHRNFRSKTLVPIKTDYEAANIKVKMVVPDWLQTDVTIKLNTQTDITECREAITELDHAVSNLNSHSRNHHDAQAEKIRAETLPKLSCKVDLKKQGHCLNCGKSNHKFDTCGVGPVDTRVYPVGQSAKKQQ
ncbi:hypothetical protein ACTFIR_012911 [Dictyostelium discoideum]